MKNKFDLHLRMLNEYITFFKKTKAKYKYDKIFCRKFNDNRVRKSHAQNFVDEKFGDDGYLNDEHRTSYTEV